MNNHYKKYLKYKAKYINLKNSLQVSGSSTDLIEGHKKPEAPHPNKGAKCLRKGQRVKMMREPTIDEIINAYSGCTNYFIHEVSESLKEMKEKLDMYSNKNQQEQVKLLKDRNYNLLQLATAGYDLKLLKEAGFTLMDFTAKRFVDPFQITKSDLIKIGFTENQLVGLKFRSSPLSQKRGSPMGMAPGISMGMSPLPMVMGSPSKR